MLWRIGITGPFRFGLWTRRRCRPPSFDPHRVLLPRSIQRPLWGKPQYPHDSPHAGLGQPLAELPIDRLADQREGPQT